MHANSMMQNIILLKEKGQIRAVTTKKLHLPLFDPELLLLFSAAGERALLAHN
jgi:hypothetical protein